MLLGKKGVKYGLQLPAKPATKQTKPHAAISAFQEGPDNEDTIGQQIARQQAKISTDVKVADLHAKALAEDPSIFDYDSHFDTMQEQKVRPAMQEKIERKSRYIEALKDKAVQREREQNVVYERRVAKERSAEDHLFGDKEKYVTAAYKKKLEEEKKWLAEEKVREAQEAKNDVVKKGHMGDFYRNILKTNDVRTGLKKPEEEEARLASAAAAQDDSATAPASAAGRHASSHTEAALSGAQDPKWDTANAARQRHATATSAAEPASSPARKRDKADAAAPQDPAADSANASSEPVEEEEQAASAPPEPTKEERIAAAREKYLSRKRQRTGA